MLIITTRDLTENLSSLGWDGSSGPLSLQRCGTAANENWDLSSFYLYDLYSTLASALSKNLLTTSQYKHIFIYMLGWKRK